MASPLFIIPAIGPSRTGRMGIDTLNRVKRLIVNADDFGLTSGVNRAIVELHRRGVLTSATLMANAPATDEAIALAKATPTLGVGCHVVLVDGEPVLAPRRDLVWIADPIDGRFNPGLGSFLNAVYCSERGMPVPASRKQRLIGEIEAEAAAQIARIQSRGVRLTHVDTHKHTHMFPRVLRPVLRAARAAGITAVRNPFEPAWSIAATPGAPLMRRLQVKVLRRLETAFHRIVREEGFTTTDGAVGVLATGTLDEVTVRTLLSSLPDGTWELVTHPGHNDAALAQAGTRLLASRETEMEALGVLAGQKELQLISFAQLGAQS